MSDQSGFLSRLGNFFKRTIPEEQRRDTNPDAPRTFEVPGGTGAHGRVGDDNGAEQVAPAPSHDVVDSRPLQSEARGTFLRPWAKRDAAIDNLQSGVGALTDLMTGINDHLQRQSKRQDEMLQYLSHLPALIEKLPEGNRLQAETLRAIHNQMERQTTQQSKLAEILERITEADGRHGRTLEALEASVSGLRDHDEAISGSLKDVGAVMQTMGRNSETSAQVLQQLRDNITVRDGEMERILHQQGARHALLLGIAIFLAATALIVAGVIGYLGLTAMNHAK